MKKYLSAFSLAMAICISLTACSPQPENTDSSSSKPKFPSSEELPENEESAEPEQAAVSSVHSDSSDFPDQTAQSRIAEICSFEGSFPEKDGHIRSCVYHIPQLKAESDSAQSLNRCIRDVYGTWAEESLAALEKNEIPAYSSITYCLCRHDSLFSLVLHARRTDGGISTEAFHYDLNEEAWITDEKMAEILKIDPEKAAEQAKPAVLNYFDEMYRSMPSEKYSEYISLRQETARDIGPWSNLYLDSQNDLHYLAQIAVPDGKAPCIFDCMLQDMPDSAVYKTDQNLQIKAELKNNRIYLIFDETLSEDISVGKRYEVKRLCGNYRDIAVVLNGPGFSPWLIMLTDTGRVEYLNIPEQEKKGEGFYSEGMLTGLPPVTGIHQGSLLSENGSGTNLIELTDAEGTVYRLSELLRQRNASVREAPPVFGSCMTSWSSMDGRIALDVEPQNPDKPLRLTEFRDGVCSGFYRGDLIFAGEYNGEILYDCCFYDESGTVRKKAQFAVLSTAADREHLLHLRYLSGDSVFGPTETGTVILNRTFG